MIQLLRQRRSIRKYSSSPVSKETVDLLVESLLRSPTSRNRKPWQFIVVDDAALLADLSASKQHGSAFLKEAPLGIVIAADSNKSDVWIEDTSIAAILVQAVAESLGLGSCWIQIRNRPHDEATSAETFIQKRLGLPEEIKVTAIISIGYPAESKPPVPAAELDFDKVSRNQFSTKF